MHVPCDLRTNALNKCVCLTGSFSEDRFFGKKIEILRIPRVVKTRQDNLCFPSCTYHIYGPQICCKRVDFEMLFSKFTRSRFYLLFTCMPSQHSACITDFTVRNGLLCYRARNFDPHLITYFQCVRISRSPLINSDS